jgi:hypothetical protein
MYVCPSVLYLCSEAYVQAMEESDVPSASNLALLAPM